jgi:hypothetical protein
LQKGSGLFSILPAPKNLCVKETKRSLVPHVLKKKSTSITSTPSSVKSETGDPVKNASESLMSYADSEDESDGEGDFFSLKTDNKVEAINNANTTSITPIMANNGFDTNDNISANNGDALKSNDEPLAFRSEFSPLPWASGASQDGHEVYGQWQNDMEPTTQTAFGNSNDNISAQPGDLQLNDEAVSCITIEMFSFKY